MPKAPRLPCHGCMSRECQDVSEQLHHLPAGALLLAHGPPHIMSGTWAMTLSKCKLFKDCLHNPARMPAGILRLVQCPERAHHVTPHTRF